MSSLNKIQLIGNLGSDPETKVFDNGDQVTNFTIATSEKWKDKQGQPQESTEWHKVVCRNGISKIVDQYVTKGQKVYIEGKLKTRSYESNGQTNYITEVMASNIIMLGGKDKEPPF